MLRPFDRTARTAPSQYPRIPFHALRCVQTISSCIVGGIMCFFIWHLTHDHWPTPWTFVWLTAASLFSIAALSFTIILHCCTGLKPTLNLAVNAFLALLWTLSWCLLTWYMSPTLANMCDVEHWTEEVGVMVCRIYKALFTFTLFGFLSTLAALALDIYVHRQQTRRGIYRLHDLDSKSKPKQRRPEATRGPFTDDVDDDYNINNSKQAGEPRESEAWEAPRPSIGPYDELSRETLAAVPSRQQPHGYAVPENQFRYDTGYHGGHAERGYGS